jgi:hypothetical protein
MKQALRETNVSFCTRKHFGRTVKNEIGDYLRFAYSGINVDNINEGMARLKLFFDK